MKRKKEIKDKKTENDLKEKKDVDKLFNDLESRFKLPGIGMSEEQSKEKAELLKLFIDYSTSKNKLGEILKSGMLGKKPAIDGILDIFESINKAFLALTNFKSTSLPLKNKLPEIEQKKEIEQIDIELEPVEVEPETVETQKTDEQETEFLKIRIEDLTKRVNELEKRAFENKETLKVGSEIKSVKKRLPKSESQIEKIPLNGSKRQIRRLFNALKKELLLRGDIEYLEFEIHFDIKGIEIQYQETETNKIRWMGTIRQLVYLNHLLIQKKLFDEEKKYKLLADNFKDINGNDLNPTQLCNSYKEFGTNPKGKRYDQIRGIVANIGN